MANPGHEDCLFVTAKTPADRSKCTSLLRETKWFEAYEADEKKN